MNNEQNTQPSVTTIARYATCSPRAHGPRMEFDPDGDWVSFNAHASELRAAVDLAERLKQEAQIHAQEARTANATIAEIYKLVTGATGEPGRWNGAEPVREYMRAAVEKAESYREALKQIAAWRLPEVSGLDGALSSYTAEYGSNGARDYMRALASEALK